MVHDGEQSEEKKWISCIFIALGHRVSKKVLFNKKLIAFGSPKKNLSVLPPTKASQKNSGGFAANYFPTTYVQDNGPKKTLRCFFCLRKIARKR